MPILKTTGALAHDLLMACVFGSLSLEIMTPKSNNCFTSCDPHHDIYTFCYWQIFWSLLAFYLTCYLAFYLAYLLAFYLTYLLAFYLAYLLAFYLAYPLAYVLAYLLAYYLANLLAFYLANILALYLAYLLAFYLTFYLAYLLAFYLAVEVQRCALSWGGPRLRSSGAH